MTKTSPILNSVAEKIKKKKVRPKLCILSFVKPRSITSAYKVIHRISAVSKRCKEV